MKLVIVGSEDECLGFSLAGVEGIVASDELFYTRDERTAWES